MTTVNLNQLDLTEFVGKDNSRQHCKATFPLFGAHGTQRLATVYFEIEPGDHLGMHTDSAEELLIILSGDAEVTIGKQADYISAGSMALVPKFIPHNISNIGIEKVRVLGVFGGANNIIATFENDWLPTNSNIVDTAQLV